MKILNYFINLLRLGKHKLRGHYIGSILQNIPASTVTYIGSGTLSIKGRLSCRENGYLSAGSGYLEIGEGCFFNQGINLVSKEKIVFGKNVIVGPNVVIVDHDHDYKKADRQNMFVTDPIVIGDNVWIGANAVILKGTNIGMNSVIGAGTVVKGDIPANSLIYQERKTMIKNIEIEGI